MRLNKRIAMFLMAMSIATTMSVAPAMATTLKLPAQHTDSTGNLVTGSYEILQIFTGDYQSGVLTNLKWGVNGIGTTGTAIDLDDATGTYYTELQALLNATTDAAAVAAAQALLDTSSSAWQTASSGDTISNVSSGYYLVRDAGTVASTDSYTYYILKVNEDNDGVIEIKRKSDVPSVDKQVLDTGLGSSASGDWDETADHTLFENFQFKLTANLPSTDNYDLYTNYALQFDDTMSSGLTFVGIDSVILYDSTGNVLTTLSSSQYTLSSNAVSGAEGISWTLKINDVKSLTTSSTKGGKVEVIYTAFLNENAVVSNIGTSTDAEKNTVKLEFDNNPNSNGEGETGGETPEDHTFVFNYEVEQNKFTQQTTGGVTTNVNLAEAKFRIYSDLNIANQVAAGTLAVTDPTAVAAEISFVAGTYTKNGSTVNGYRPAKTGETGVELQSDSNGMFNVFGVDAGTYYLAETAAPSGYNKLTNAVTVTVTATHTEDTTGNQATATSTLTQDSNTVSQVAIENKKGIELPETGGIGTIALYFAGSAIVAGVLAVLVNRRKRTAVK